MAWLFLIPALLNLFLTWFIRIRPGQLPYRLEKVVSNIVWQAGKVLEAGKSYGVTPQAPEAHEEPHMMSLATAVTTQELRTALVSTLDFIHTYSPFIHGDSRTNLDALRTYVAAEMSDADMGKVLAHVQPPKTTE